QVGAVAAERVPCPFPPGAAADAAAHLVAGCQQLQGDMAAEEAGNAGDENAFGHRFSITAAGYPAATIAQPPLFSLAKMASSTRICRMESSTPQASRRWPSTARAKASACSVYWSTAGMISRRLRLPSSETPASTRMAVGVS